MIKRNMPILATTNRSKFGQQLVPLTLQAPSLRPMKNPTEASVDWLKLRSHFKRGNPVIDLVTIVYL